MSIFTPKDKVHSIVVVKAELIISKTDRRSDNSGNSMKR